MELFALTGQETVLANETIGSFEVRFRLLFLHDRHLWIVLKSVALHVVSKLWLVYEWALEWQLLVYWLLVHLRTEEGVQFDLEICSVGEKTLLGVGDIA